MSKLVLIAYGNELVRLNKNQRPSGSGQSSGTQSAPILGTGASTPTNYREEETREMRKQKGFSLIELLIVVAIILIIAAIAIPNLLRARIAANEASAVSSLRTINTGMVTYSTTYPTVGYAATLAILGPKDATCSAGPAETNACMVDFNLGSAAKTAKSGYLLDAANDGLK